MKRNIGLCILFSFLTCGLYQIYWFYKVTENLGDLSGDHSISPGLAILFSFLTCGIYTIYWAYKMGKLVGQSFENKSLGDRDESVLYLILSIFGLNIIVLAIAQSNINQLANEY